jgi:hypothetical protein
MTRLLPSIAREGAHHPHALRSRLWLTLVLPTLALLALAGCGSSSDNGVAAKPADEILQATRSAAQNASSVHVLATSKALNGRPLKLDASLSKQQAHAQISFFGFNFRAIRDADTLYIKGNPRFDARLESTLGVKIPPGKWLKGTTTSSLGQIASFTDISKELPLILSGTGKTTKGNTTKINGQPAITLKLTRKLYTGTLYIATTGQPYPLKLIKTPPKAGPSETGHTTFTNWDEPVTITPPASAIDITQLQQLKKKGH